MSEGRRLIVTSLEKEENNKKRKRIEASENHWLILVLVKSRHQNPKHFNLQVLR